MSQWLCISLSCALRFEQLDTLRVVTIPSGPKQGSLTTLGFEVEVDVWLVDEGLNQLLSAILACDVEQGHLS